MTTHDGPLIFEWDPGTGQVRGEGAPRVLSLCADAVKAGGVVGHPYPTDYEIRDPLRRPAELAVVLGQFWRIEGDLASAYPSVGDDEEGLVEVAPDGADGALIEPLR